MIQFIFPLSIWNDIVTNPTSCYRLTSKNSKDRFSVGLVMIDDLWLSVCLLFRSETGWWKALIVSPRNALLYRGIVSPWEESKMIPKYLFELQQIVIHSFMFVFGLKSLFFCWLSKSVQLLYTGVWTSDHCLQHSVLIAVLPVIESAFILHVLGFMTISH